MPTVTSVTINDRKSTPLAHVFSPEFIRDGVANLINTSANGGILAGAERLQVGVRKSNTRARTTLNLTLPVVQSETINGVSRPVVVRTGYAKVEFTHDVLATPQERADLVGLVANAILASQTMITKVIVDAEAPSS